MTERSESCERSGRLELLESFETVKKVDWVERSGLLKRLGRLDK